MLSLRLSNRFALLSVALLLNLRLAHISEGCFACLQNLRFYRQTFGCTASLANHTFAYKPVGFVSTQKLRFCNLSIYTRTKPTPYKSFAFVRNGFVRSFVSIGFVSANLRLLSEAEQARDSWQWSESLRLSIGLTKALALLFRLCTLNKSVAFVQARFVRGVFVKAMLTLSGDNSFENLLFECLLAPSIGFLRLWICDCLLIEKRF